MGSAPKDPTTPPSSVITVSAKTWGDISPRATPLASPAVMSGGSVLNEKDFSSSPSDQFCKSDCKSSDASLSGDESSNDRMVDQRGRCLPFLEKTYRMIEASPADLAAWSDKGDSFIVFHPKDFSEKVIPLYFKHKNFSSFVRQLNFYGFRKTKASAKGKKAKNPDGSEKEWWEFRHEKFIRGNKSLMKTIKRKTNMQEVHMGGHHHPGVNSAALTEVKALRSDIVVLSSKVKETSEKLQTVTDFVLNLLKTIDTSKQKSAQPSSQAVTRRAAMLAATEAISEAQKTSSLVSTSAILQRSLPNDTDIVTVKAPVERGINVGKKRKISNLAPLHRAKFLKPIIDTKLEPVPAPTTNYLDESSQDAFGSVISPRALRFDFHELDLGQDVMCEDLDVDKLFENPESPSSKSSALSEALKPSSSSSHSHTSWATDEHCNSLLSFSVDADDFPVTDPFFESWQQMGQIGSPRHSFEAAMA